MMSPRVSAELDRDRQHRLQFRRAPLAAAALAFACGIVLGHVAHPEAGELAAALAALALLSGVAVSRNLRTAVLPVLAVWIVLGAAALEWFPAPFVPASLLARSDNLSRLVRAHVIRVRLAPHVSATSTADVDPVPAWEQTEVPVARVVPLTLDLAVDEIEDVTPDRSTMVPAEGGIRVSVYPDAPSGSALPSLQCGDRVELPLRLKLPDTYRTPGAFDFAGFLLTQGISAHGGVAAGRIVQVGPAPASLRCQMYAAQTWASGRLTELSGYEAGGHTPSLLRLSNSDALMLNAMLFGDRSGLSHQLRKGFERTGTFHLFVVSGLHIALAAAGLFWLLRKLRLSAWLSTLFTIAGATGYAALTGFGAPAQRALTMTAVFLLARLLSRDRDTLNALGAAVLVMLVLAPASLFDTSFQMTTLIILAIAGIAVPLSRYTAARRINLTRLIFRRPRTIFIPRAAQFLLMLELWGEAVALLLPRKLERHTRKLPASMVRFVLIAFELTLISMVAELVLVLPMALYFHRLPVFAVPANVLMLPLIGILIPCAVATFLLSLVSLKLAAVPAAVTALLLHSITSAIDRLSSLAQADVRIPGPVWWLALVALAGWGVCCWAVRLGRRGALLTALAVPAIALLLLWPESEVRTPGTLEVTALDVGQGDSLLIVNPEGSTMLIDAGGPVGSHGVSETVSSFDVGEQVVAPYLWTRRIRRLDVLVLSHAHTDHMGGMPAVLGALRPRELWVGIDPVSPLYAELLRQATALHIHVRHLHAGHEEAWGSVDVQVLAPSATYANAGTPRNDDSLVLRLQLGKASVLLEGDAERSSEDAMLAAHLVVPATLLKVGHHGSKTSSNPEFLAAVQPKAAVISVGRNNTFGHPRAEVIDRFAASGTTLFRTDRMGTTSFLLYRDGVIRAAADGAPMRPIKLPSNLPVGLPALP